MDDFQDDPPRTILHPTTEECFYVLWLFVDQLLEVRPDARTWSEAAPQAELDRWIRLDQVEESIRRFAEHLWEIGGGDVRERLRETAFEDARRLDASDLPWHLRLSEFQSHAEILRALISVQRDKFSLALGQRVVRVRGFCGNSVLECFAQQIADFMYKLNQHEGAGLPGGVELLAVLREWETELTAESARLTQADLPSARPESKPVAEGAGTSGQSASPFPALSSEATAPGRWDPRSSFHRAVLRVHADLAALVASLPLEPKYDIALKLLDEAIRRSWIDSEEPQPLLSIKQGVRQLRSSLGVVRAVREAHRGIESDFAHGACAGWGGITTLSYHAVLISAAHAMLEAQSNGFGEILPQDHRIEGSNAIREQVLRDASNSASSRRLVEDLKSEYELASLRPPQEPAPDYDEGLAQVEEARLDLKRVEVQKVTTSKDIARLFSLWESTTDLLFRSNPGAALSRPEELFHLGRVVFALAEVAHAKEHPHVAMNKLSQLLKVVVPLTWFDDAKAHQELKDAICLAGDEINDLYFDHRLPASNKTVQTGGSATGTTTPELAGDHGSSRAAVNDLPLLGDRRLPQLNRENAALDFTGTSELAVTAIVRALNEMRKSAPDFVPKKERIKEKAGKAGGAGDRAVGRAMELGLITADYLLTDRGRQFLAARS